MMEKTEINEKIKENLPFIVKRLSQVSGRYIHADTDELLTIGMLAFQEALERYEESRGEFLPFAGLVIESRAKSYLSRESSRCHREVSLELLEEEGTDLAGEEKEDKGELLDEISAFKQELLWFHLSLEQLAKEAPRHRDTRKRAAGAGRTIAGDEALVKKTYEKRRLPVKETAERCRLTLKIVKDSKSFILSIMIVFVKRFRNLILWLQEAGNYNE